MIFCFVTIRIFARTEHGNLARVCVLSFVTIRIFARTEQKLLLEKKLAGFVTIRIFARTEREFGKRYRSYKFCYHKDFC